MNKEKNEIWIEKDGNDYKIYAGIPTEEFSRVLEQRASYKKRVFLYHNRQTCSSIKEGEPTK